MTVAVDDSGLPVSWQHLVAGSATREVSVPIGRLLPADSPRRSGASVEHVRALAKADGPLHPILVHRPTMRVIDGMHRLRAASLRGDAEIGVRYFDGSTADAFVIAVQANAANGLPLTLDDRRAAAQRIMETHPERSDRWIAEVSGLAASTVAGLRRRSTDADEHTNTRLGRDGRARPLDSSEGRLRAGELMRADPSRSLRDVARAAGIAPSTALDVRNRLKAGEDPLPPRRRRACPEPSARQEAAGADPACAEPAAIMNGLRRDPSLRFSDSGRTLLRWLDAHSVPSESPERLLAAVPSHCAGTIGVLARRNAQFWTEFGQLLDAAEQRFSSAETMRSHRNGDAGAS